ncbi:signal peptidase I [Bacillus tamaricis]|uniref:Signal peptidase I n=2 Tax=Evansella tamaricis TaxID=2069301 RepID=A0ABS6JEL2_9BACI|nr:signal peptidase I [Evansella tamaricis]
MKAAKLWANRIISGILFISLIILTVLVISTKASGGEPQFFGYQLKMVLSGSMEPEFKTGSIIAVKPGGDMTRFQPGDIITFMHERDLIVTHRIEEVIHSGDHVLYRTKGDSNASPDTNPVLSENVLAEYTGFTIPYIGYVANFAQSKEGGALLLIIPGLFMLFHAAATISQGITELEKGKKEQDHSEKQNDMEDPLKST